MDSSELNKIAGAAIGALLLFLLLGFFSGKVYDTRPSAHKGPEVQAFALEIEGADDAVAADDAGPDYAALLASADLDAGKKVFNKCKSCHKIEDGANGIGPHLWNIVGREKQAVDGFAYSGALAAVGGSWGFSELNAFFEKPSAYASGTSMSFGGLRKPEDRVNLIAWLNAESGSNADLAAGLDQAAAPAEAEVQTAAVTTETEAPAAEAPAAEAPATETEAPAAETEASTEQAAAPAQEETATQEAPAATETEAPAQEAEAPAAEQVAAAAYPAGDAAAGEKVFRKCRACHKVEDGANGVGPHLWGVVNRDIASVEGFKYSNALQGLEGAWTATELDAFLTKPKDYAKGNKMSFAGLRKEEDRINVITYLNEADGSPEPLQ